MKKLQAVLILTLLTIPATAATIYVDDDGPADFNDIQSAVNVADFNDIIIVHPGVYYGEINLYKPIILRSTDPNDPCIVNNTIISGNKKTRCIYAGYILFGEIIINGFYIIDGSSTSGGGIYSFHGSNLTIENCVFSENLATNSSGGAIFFIKRRDIYPRSLYVKNCIFLENSAYIYGGAIFYRNSDTENPLAKGPFIENCVFIGNSINDTYLNSSSAIYCLGGSPEVTNCIFERNINFYRSSSGSQNGWYGSTVYCEDCNSILTNCSFIQNNITSYRKNIIHGDSYSSGILTSIRGSVKINNCIFTGNYGIDSGGLYVRDANTVLTNSLFSGNYALGAGAAVLDRAQVRNCTFVKNLSKSGSILNCRRDVNISNSIFSNNTAKSKGQIMVGHETTVDINYCDIKGSQGEIYNNYGTLNWGAGNIDVDPCFVDPGYWDGNGTPADTNDDFFVEGDYHLLPVSLCINSGDPAFVLEPGETDLDGIERVIDDRIDMGCYESDAIKVPVKLSPSAINVKSFGCFITAIITLPKDITPADIDKNDPLLFLPGNLNSRHQFIWQSGFGKFRRTYIMAVFNKSDCMQYLNNGQNEVTVIGSLKSGQFYYGTDKLFVIPWNPWFWWFH